MTSNSDHGKPWFGFHMPNYTFPDTPPERLFDRVAELARAAEDAGFAQVTVMDHLYQIGGVGAADQPMLEAYTTLGALARETSRVRLGVLVAGVTYRNPALLVKETATLDTISGGRAMFGIGAAWNEVEHVGYGYDFPPVRERMDRLEEAVTIARAMFTQDQPTFEGRYYRIEEALNFPRPVRPGGPPILIGGGGEKRTLRIAAKHADMTHWFSLGIDALKRKTAVLEGYCAEIGRDPASIERTMGAPVLLTQTDDEAQALLQRIPADRRPHLVAGPPAKVADSMRPYLDAGFTGFTFANTTLGTPSRIAAAGELLRLIS
jgi:F420-dependent oxidoreductase-like protein